MPASADPIERFLAVFSRAHEMEPGDATAAALATANGAGRPSARMVLLKTVDHRGFVFFTNFRSRKARELDANPWAALCFYWTSLAEQIRVEGPVARISEEESDAYFASRPRNSQVGAWASDQSSPLSSRARLIARFLELQVRFAGRRVPRPPHWGGYRLRPERIEFWSNRADRLHDRLLYTREGDGWRAQRLYP